MAGFLRRFANKKNAGVEQHAIPAPSKPVVDAAPPSLPPLFARFATTTLEEPDPTSIFDSYISSPMSPPPPPNQLAGEWDAWKALIEDAPVEPLPAPPPPKKEPTRILHLPITRRKYTGPGLPPQIKAPDSPDATNAYYTTQSRPSTAPSGSTPRPIRAASIRQDRIEQPSNTRNSLVVQSTHFTSPVKHPRPLAPEIPSPVTIPHPSPHPPSLSLDNQAPSYTPLKTRYSHPASQDSQPAQPNRFRENPIPIQKPSSSSSHTSSTTHSSSNHTDATRFKRSGSFTSAFTSTSSIAPAIKQIDVTRPNSQGRSSSAQRLARPNLASPNSPSSLSSPGANANSQPGPSRSHSHRPLQPVPEPPLQRNLTHTTTTVTNNRSPAAPPPRPLTHMDTTPKPVLSIELSAAPIRKGPLIFATLASISQPDNSVNATISAPTARHDHDLSLSYPSPPAEYMSLEQGLRRVGREAGRGLSEAGRPSESGRGPSIEAGRMPPVRKLSKNSVESKPRVLTKTRPSSPPKLHLQKLPTEGLLEEDTLFLDADPFAKADGVQVVKIQKGDDEPATPARPSTPPPRPKSPLTPDSPEDYKSARTQRRGQWLEKSRPPLVADVIAQQDVMSKEAELLQEEEEARLRKEEEKRQKEEEARRLKAEAAQRQKEEEEEKLRLEAELARPRTPVPPTFYPIVKHLADATMLPHLMTWMTFSDWCSLYGASKEIRVLFESRVLREYVLEHFLRTVGYASWKFEWAEPLALSLKDLNDYMRGVSMPTHQYSQLSETYLQARVVNPGDARPKLPDILSLAMTTRAYTRVVLRMRAQAESEARAVARSHTSPTSSRPSSRPGTRDGRSRTPSPTSLYSQSHGKSSGSGSAFRSPLVRLHRAPLLRVFVPSPDGEWLSDSSVVECEAELKRAGVLKMLRVGDVVWDVAVGDEGNLGRMVWDGSYLVDLDYKYSRMGELSPYFHSLAFSPSYFHRVVRTGVNAAMNPNGNPVVYLDVSPWGQELAANLQLLQDRGTTTTPHGTLHSVVHWLHRSSFTIRPPVSPHHPHAYSHSQNLRLPIPNVAGFFIDPGWYGTVVVEAEGTNEGLADFQARCGPGAFPPRADNITSKMRNEKEKDSRRVYRVLREKSRPGEIWIRAVREKERVM